MPDSTRLSNLVRRGPTPAEAEPPGGSTPKGLFLRKFRPKPGGAQEPPPPDAPGQVATPEKVLSPHALEQQPAAQSLKTAAPTSRREPPKKVAKKDPPSIDVPYHGKHKAWPLALMKQLHHDHGWDWIEWDPDALWSEIGNPAPVVRDIIGALRTLFTSEAFWNEFHVFLWTCQALNGRPVDFRMIPELDPAEIMYAVLTVEQIRGQKKVQLPNKAQIEGAVYSSEVLATIAACFRMAGMVYVPPPVEGATSLLLEQIDASNATLSEQAKAAWAAIIKGQAPKATETVLGVQIARLIAIHEYTEEVSDA